MVDRMIRASKAEVALYEEVENNPSLTQEAYTVVGIVAAINFVVSLGWGFFGEGGMGGALFGAIFSAVSVFIGYLLWSYLTYYIGTKMFNGTADVGELQRTLGYAMTPQVLGFIPCVGFLAALWSLYLGVIAVRQALDFDTTKALLTAGIAFAIQFVIFMMIGLTLGVGAAATGAITGG